MARPTNYRQIQPNSFYSNASVRATIARQLYAQGHSIIPLIGGDDPDTGKRPALSVWKSYQIQQANQTEIDAWLADGMTAYGVVCGQSETHRHRLPTPHPTACTTSFALHNA